jgi:hypothetical protein
MKPRFKEMSHRIPNDVGQTVQAVYDKLRLDDNEGVKQLPRESNNDYLSPIVQSAMAYHSLGQEVAEKRVTNDLLDRFSHYRDNTQLNREASIYMSICATADLYSNDDNGTDVATGNLFPPR